MATATLLFIYCVKEATGTDLSAIQAIASLPEKIVPSEFGFSNILDAIQSLPGVIAAIDMARSDPDNLYITTSTEGNIDNSIWPGSGNTQDFQAGQSDSPQVAIEFSFSLNISLWDKDEGGVFGSDDDLLGSITIFETEQGQGEITKKAFSVVEGSYYYVTYIVE
jgi:hypothetical protein